MTPIFCCGGECGVAGAHWDGSPAFSTSTVRSGARSIRVNPSASIVAYSRAGHSASQILIARFYIRFASFPTARNAIFCTNLGGGFYPGIFYDNDGSGPKLYAGVNTSQVFGEPGIAVALDRWHRVDAKIITNANPWLIDGQVDGVPMGQRTLAAAADSDVTLYLGDPINNGTSDYFIDDFVLSTTLADYPIGPGYVNHFIPTADGTHNVAGANDFERGTLGTDITNSTTDSYLLIDDVPMDDTTPDTDDFINAIAPPNATDYVEHVFGPAPGIITPVVGPRAVEVIVAYHQAGTGSGSSQFRLNDNGTEDTIVALSGAGVTTTRYSRKHYATMVGGGAWTAARFNALRHRFGFVGDANPDQYFDCAMIEAEFEDRFGKQQIVQQAVKRASFY